MTFATVDELAADRIRRALNRPGAYVTDEPAGRYGLRVLADRRRPTDALNGREAQAARGRRLAFYVVHVGLGWSLERTGRPFGRRRSTVSHACRQVEDRRDPTALDRQVARLEAVMGEAVVLRLDL